MREVGPHATVREAREYVKERIEEGVSCPCCGSWNRVYSRRLNRAKVRELREIFAFADDQGMLYDYVNIPASGVSLRNREYPKLRFWGLLEPRDPDVGSGEGTGWWRVTPQGVAFVRGTLSLPNKVLEYRSRVLRVAEDAVTVDIHEAFRDTSVDPDELNS